jgi:non-ribosomal peptide synthetase component F
MDDNVLQGYDLSPQQRHLWLVQRGDHSAPYHAQSAILIEGKLHVAVSSALQQIVERHEILRTTIHDAPGRAIPLQIVNKSSILSIQTHNISGLGQQEQANRIAALFHEMSQQDFDLAHVPLLRLALVTLSPERQLLLVSLPAMCADRASLKNLVHEISCSYAACLHRREIADKPLQYVDFSGWQNELLASADANVERASWREHVDSLDVKLFFEHQQSEMSRFQPRTFSFVIHSDLIAQIETLARKYRTSTSTFLLACWYVLIWRLAEQPDIVIGTYCDCRAYEELEKAFGLFATYLPLYCQLADHIPFHEALELIDASLQGIYEDHEHFSWKQIERSVDHVEDAPFFSICFDFDDEIVKFSAEDISFSLYKQYTCIDRYNIKLSCVIEHGALVAEFHYDSSIFASDAIERLAERFRALLASAVATPEAAIAALAIIGDAERRQLLVEFNDTQADAPRSAGIHHLFEEQATRAPDAVALVADQRPTTNDQRPAPTAPSLQPPASSLQHLTYRELNARANQLAHYLHRCGVGPEVLVAVCVERSAALVIALLGVLKAGGAYVPLDPAYPKERLAFMLADAQVSVLITATDQRPTTKDEGRKTKDEAPVSPCHLVTLSPCHGTVIDLSADWPAIARQPAQPPPSAVAADNLAYVIYTSGSTGVPKGVLGTHGGAQSFRLDVGDLSLHRWRGLLPEDRLELYRLGLGGVRAIAAGCPAGGAARRPARRSRAVHPYSGRATHYADRAGARAPAQPAGDRPGPPALPAGAGLLGQQR